ncbi:hypothetical protein D3C84_938480 [compost metagenome]
MVTVNSALALKLCPFALPEAVMVAVPAVTPVARPLSALALLMVVIVASLLLQLRPVN